MDIKYQDLCEWVERDLLRLNCVDTAINLADLFTKHLGPTLFTRHADYVLGHIPPHYMSQCLAVNLSPSKIHTPHAAASTLLLTAMIWRYISHNLFAATRRPSSR